MWLLLTGKMVMWSKRLLNNINTEVVKHKKCQRGKKQLGQCILTVASSRLVWLLGGWMNGRLNRRMSTGWLVGWLAGWLTRWLVGWLVGWLAGWMDGWMDVSESSTLSLELID